MTDDGDVAYDTDSSSIIRLNNATILYLKEVNRYLALVCILREDNFDRQGDVLNGERGAGSMDGGGHAMAPLTSPGNERRKLY